MSSTAQDLFVQAHELEATEREVFLAKACGDDAELRLEIQGMFVEAERADSFFADGDGETIGAEEFQETYAEKEGDLVGPYKLLQQIGEGGFGTVWMAEQSEPISRKVALKVIKAGMDTKQVLARFEAERQALAMMDHPNIAKVLDAGATSTGRPYFAMELVKGIPITTFCDEKGLGTKKRLALFREVCSAINHAHQKGIIHRDIKPSNVMVTLHGDKPVVKIIDFGIAKATEGKLTEKTLFTRFEQFIGTPVYMSPEQASLSGLDIDTRSDIYALGILLYELLVGKAPFDAKSLVSAGYEEMRRIIREVEPPKPSSRLSTLVREERTAIAKARHIEPDKISRLVESDLDWIVMKAIDKDRSRRYETANAFAQDIECFLADEAVTAIPPSAGYQFRKFAKRNRMALRLAAVITLMLLATTLFSSWQALRATRAEKAMIETLAEVAAERDAKELARLEAEHARTEEAEARALAEAATAEAEASEHKAREILYAADMRATYKELQSPSSFNSNREAINRWLPSPQKEDLRGWEWYFNQSALSEQIQVSSSPEGREVMGCWSPDGRCMAKVVAVGKGNYHLKLTDAASDVLLARSENCEFTSEKNYHTEAFFRNISWSPTGSHIVVSSRLGFWIWEITPDQPHQFSLLLSPDQPDVNNWGEEGFLDWSPDGKYLVIQSTRQRATLYDLQAGKQFQEVELPHDSGEIRAIRWDSDGDSLTIATSLGFVFVWEVNREALEQIAELGLDGERWCLSRDGKRIAGVDGEARTFSIWKMDNLEAPPLVCDCGSYYASFVHYRRTFEFSPDGRFLALGSWLDNVTVWDVASGKLATVIPVSVAVFQVRWSPDSTQLYINSATRRASVWTVPPSAKAPAEKVDALVWSSDGTLLVSSNAKKITILNGESLEQQVTLPALDGTLIRDVTFHPRLPKIATLFSNGVVRIDDTVSGQKIALWQLEEFPDVTDKSQIRWCPEGNYLGIAARDTLIVLDAHSGKKALSFRDTSYRQNGIQSLAFHPTLKLVAVGANATLTLCNYQTGKKTAAVAEGWNDNFCSLAWNSEGNMLAVGYTDGVMLATFEGEIGSEKLSTRILNRERGSAHRVFWSKDSNQIFSAHITKSLSVFDLEKALEVLSVDDVSMAEIDPFGLRIAVSGADGLRMLDPSTAYHRERSPAVLPRLNARLMQDPYSAKDLENRALIHLCEGRWDEAKRDLARVEGIYSQRLSIDPNDRVSFVLLSRIRQTAAEGVARAGHWEDASLYLERDFVAGGSKWPDLDRDERSSTRFRYALALAESGRIEESERIWQLAQKLAFPSKTKGSEDPIISSCLHVQVLANNKVPALRNPPQALERAKKLAEHHPDRTVVMITLGLAQYRCGQLEEALISFETSERLDPISPAFERILLAMTLGRLGRNAVARASYDSAVATATPEILSSDVFVRFRTEALLVMHGIDLTPLSDQALALAEEGHVEEAVTAFSQALDGVSHPDIVTAIAKMALPFEEVFAALKERRPEHVGVFASCQWRPLSEKAVALAEEVNIEGAAIAFAQALDGVADPDIVTAIAKMALPFEEVFAALKERRPEHSEQFAVVEAKALIKRGQALLDAGNFEEGGAKLELALSANSVSSDTRRAVKDDLKKRSDTLIADGKLEDGLSCLRWKSVLELNELDPNHSITVMKIAALQVWFGRDADYSDTRQRMLKWAQDSSFPSDLNRVAKLACLRPLTDPIAAQSSLLLAKRSVELGRKKPQSLPWYHLAHGIAEYRSGNYPEAEEALIQATQLSGTKRIEDTASFYRAMSLFQQDKQEEARTLFAATEATMKDLPADDKNPLAKEGDDHDDLILWLAYREVKAMLGPSQEK